MNCVLRSSYLVAPRPPLHSLDSIEPLFNAVTAWLGSLGLELPQGWGEGWPKDMPEPVRRTANYELAALFDPPGSEPLQFAVRLLYALGKPEGTRLHLDTVVGPAPAASEAKFRVTHSVGLAGSSYASKPDHSILRLPQLARTLLADYRCHAGIEMDAQIQELAFGVRIAEAAGQIGSSVRELPTVAAPAGASFEAIAQELAGIAHFWQWASSDAQTELGRELGFELPAGSGADEALVFWPQQAAAEFEPVRMKQLKATLAAATLQRDPADGISTWEELAIHKGSKSMRKMAKKTAAADQGEAQQDDVDRLSRELRMANERAEALNGELEAAQNQIANYVRSDSLLQAVRRPAEAGGQTISTVKEALEAAKKDFASELDFGYINYQPDADEFKAPLEFYLALKWLAREFVPSRRGGGDMDDQEESCKRACGFTYTANMGDSTIGMFPEDYVFKYRGLNITAKEHLGQGVSRDPKRTLRLSFHFDAESGRAVIFYVGKHQRNRKS